MGEVIEPRVVTQVDLGSETIDSKNVIIPTLECITGFGWLQTQSDKKWSTFPLTTDKRFISVSPDLLGQEVFDDMCEEVAAMITTPQGVIVLNRLKAIIHGRPLKVAATLEEA